MPVFIELYTTNNSYLFINTWRKYTSYYHVIKRGQIHVKKKNGVFK